MINTLPITPAEVIPISPEALEVANCYLQNPTPAAVAENLDLPLEVVSQFLDRDEVRAYINNVYFNTGYNNRFTLRNLMDTVIQRKLQDMDESDTGSAKDIADLIKLSHDLTMQHLDKELKILELKEKAKNKGPSVQNNVQINEVGGNYQQLIEKILKQ